MLIFDLLELWNLRGYFRADIVRSRVSNGQFVDCLVMAVFPTEFNVIVWMLDVGCHFEIRKVRPFQRNSNRTDDKQHRSIESRPTRFS